ncbi:MAG: glycine--tRNA ligase subunit beta [Polyangiaceae bacterium]
MAQTLPVLLEIGVEELPSSFVDAALESLPALVQARLADARIDHGPVRVYGTARRLAVLIEDVATMQRDLDEEVVGPPEGAAYKDGQPTKAAEAFATKLGIPLDALTIVAFEAAGKQKAGRFVVGRRKATGEPSAKLVAEALEAVIGKIPFRKSMRWGVGDATFGRPVQWLVALFGSEVLPVTFAGVKAGNTSRGHRFLAPDTFALGAPGEYVPRMKAAHVVVDRTERAKVMMERVEAAAKAAGGDFDREPSLVDENVSLMEEPHVIRGSYDPAFLTLPPAVIRSVARGHQKYFCVQRTEDDLLPYYLAVVNTANRPDLIAKGNDRVMTSRLADARFFFEEDKKVTIASRVDKLAGIVFHAKLGTVREKVTRMEALAGTLADSLGLDAGTKADVVRGAHLCKFDLVSLMVGEFPELQGHMGRAYALHAGEKPAVADCMRDHYMPLGADGAVAPDDVSAIVALADRLDSLTGCFAIGLSPTGAADPFALRRACIAVLRTLLEKGTANPKYAALDLGALVGAAYDGFSGKKLELTREATIAKVLDFTSERLRGLVTNETNGAVADAVLAGHHVTGTVTTPAVVYPTYALAKARTLKPLFESNAPWLEKAKMVAKRLSGISKEAKPVLHPEATFTTDAGKAIAKLVADVDGVTKVLTDETSVRRALEFTEVLAIRVDELFTSTLVNDPADPATPKRLELLSYGAHCMLRIADFSKLGSAASA